MPRFTFQRRIRTASSEQYNVYDGEAETSQRAIGQVDIHYLSMGDAEASVILFDDLDGDDIDELLATLDDDLLDLPATEDSRVHATVIVGQEIGSYELSRDGEPTALDDEEPDASQLV
ncbi:hypothetical protein FJZ36_12295 [Candidatus Poribacteria bacterium]|nr:hypothetical protein [Candidatus Poribacteria bacterium]